jgi:predicted TIM-barrel fold metal-dependent hydrolase
MHPCIELDVVAAFKRQFWFDVGGIPFPSQVTGMTEGVGVGPDRFLFGTDFPYASDKAAEMLARKLDEGMREKFSEEDVKDVYVRNAEQLFSSRK